MIIGLLLVLKDSHDDVRKRTASVLRRLELYSAVLSELDTDGLWELAKYDNIFYNTALSELIDTCLETKNDIWLYMTFNYALERRLGVALVEENILIFENEEMPCKINVPIQKACTVLRAFIHLFSDQAKIYGLRWN